MKINILQLMLGIFLVVSSLLGGAYVMHGTSGEWFHFPTFMAALGGFIGGSVLIIFKGIE